MPTDNMNKRIEDLLKMLDEVDNSNREIVKEISKPMSKKEETKKETKEDIVKVMSPSEIVKKLDETVIGHTEAKKQLATIFFKYLTERLNEDRLKEMGKELTKSNILLTGDSGTGKTYLIETICQILGMDYILINSANITSAGYKGGDIEDELKRLYDKCDGDPDRIKKSVVILDELDKLKANSESNGADVNGSGAIKNILKALEGIEVSVGKSFYGSKQVLNTKDVLFVGTGTFNGGDVDIEEIVRKRIDVKGHKRAMGFFGENEYKEAVVNDRREIRKNITPDDIIEYGFSEEMLGRFSLVINLLPLTKEDYVEIAKLEKNGFGEYEALMELYGKKLTVKEEVYEYLADNMMRKKTNARALKGMVDKAMMDIVYKMVDDNRRKNYSIDRAYMESILEKAE